MLLCLPKATMTVILKVPSIQKFLTLFAPRRSGEEYAAQSLLFTIRLEVFEIDEVLRPMASKNVLFSSTFYSQKKVFRQ